MAHLQISELIPASRLEAFDYLVDPLHLPELLEPHIKVEVLTPEVLLKRGCELHFMMTRLGLSQSVRLEVEDVLRGSRLTYRQIEGLFSLWMHTTKFEDRDDGMTLVTDIVDYSVPFGLLGFLADDLIIKTDMTKVLRSRLEKAKHHFTQIRPEF